MIYSFTKRVLEELRDKSIDSYRLTASEMIETAKDSLGVCPYTGDSYNRNYFVHIANIVKEIKGRYGDDNTLPEHDEQIDSMGYPTPSVSYCIFWAFLLMEVKEGKSEKDYYWELYKDLCQTVEHELVDNGCMEDVLLAFCLKKEMSWADWIELNMDWSSKKDSYEGSRDFHRWRTLSYKEFKEITSRGLKENGLETQSSYDAINDTLEKSIFDSSSNIEEFENRVFKAENVEVIEGAEWRRTWYLYRLISMMIDHQIDGVARRIRRWIDGKIIIRNGIRVPKRGDVEGIDWAIKEALEGCALKLPVTTLMRDLRKCDSSKNAVALFRNVTDSATIGVEKIQAILDDALAGKDAESVCLLPYKRFIYHYMDKDIGEKDEDYKNRILAARRKCNIDVLNELDEHEFIRIVRKGIDKNRNSHPLLAKVLSGDTHTTKELLLLFALVVKSQDRTFDSHYVASHLLHNCRFDANLQRGERFLVFFNEAFKSISELPEKAMAYEKEELELGHGAVFYNMLKGKRM